LLLAIGERGSGRASLAGGPSATRLDPGAVVDASLGWLRGVASSAQSLLGAPAGSASPGNTFHPRAEADLSIQWLPLERARGLYDFSGGGPIPGTLYVREPLPSRWYHPAGDYEEAVALRRLALFGEVAAALGAKKIALRGVRCIYATGEESVLRRECEVAARLGLPCSDGGVHVLWRRYGRPRAPAHVPDRWSAELQRVVALQSLCEARLRQNLDKSLVTLLVGGELPIDRGLFGRFIASGLQLGVGHLNDAGGGLIRTALTFDVHFWPHGAWDPTGKRAASLRTPASGPERSELEQS